MEIKPYFIFVFILISLIIISNVYPQDDFAKTVLSQSEKSKREYEKLSPNEKKLHSGLYDLLKEAEAADTSYEDKIKFQKKLSLRSSLKVDNQQRILVLVDLKSALEISTLSETIKILGGEIIKINNDFAQVVCYLHPKKLRNLAELKSIIRISRPDIPHTKNIISLGDLQLKADSARINFSTFPWLSRSSSNRDRS